MAGNTGGFRVGRKGRSPPKKKQKPQINTKNKWRRKKTERERERGEVQSLRLKLS